MSEQEQDRIVIVIVSIPARFAVKDRKYRLSPYNYEDKDSDNKDQLGMEDCNFIYKGQSDIPIEYADEDIRLLFPGWRNWFDIACLAYHPGGGWSQEWLHQDSLCGRFTARTLVVRPA
jgi:hypothetical protein